MKTFRLSLLPIVAGLVLTSALCVNAQTVRTKIPVRGATFTVKTSGNAISTDVNGWVHAQLGPVNWSSQLHSGTYGVFKKVEVDCQITHSKKGDSFYLYQGIKGTASTLMTSSSKINSSSWTCDAPGYPGSQPTTAGTASSDWSQYPELVATIGTYSWQQYDATNHTGSIYLWDAPGVGTDSAGHVGKAGSYSTNYSFEDIVKYNVGGHLRYPRNNTHGSWTRVLSATGQLQPPTTNIYYLNVSTNN